MSAVIAMCGINYALIMSDGRRVQYHNGKLSGIVDESTSKLVRVNDKVCVGITGDYAVLEAVVFFCSDERVDGLALPKAVEAICWLVKQIKPRMPTNVLIAGKDEDGVFAIVEMKSTNGYEPQIFTINSANVHQVRCALPELTNTADADSIAERVVKLSMNVRTLDEVKVKCENLIKNIASKSETVNRNIFCEVII